MLILQRFTYFWLMGYILFKALRGELQSCGVMKRTRNMEMEIS